MNRSFHVDISGKRKVKAEAAKRSNDRGLEGIGKIKGQSKEGKRKQLREFPKIIR